MLAKILLHIPEIASVACFIRWEINCIDKANKWNVYILNGEFRGILNIFCIIDEQWHVIDLFDILWALAKFSIMLSTLQKE